MSALHQVFNTAELLSSILAYSSAQDALQFQLVRSAWHETIVRDHLLQEQHFYISSKSNATLRTIRKVHIPAENRKPRRPGYIPPVDDAYDVPMSHMGMLHVDSRNDRIEVPEQLQLSSSLSQALAICARHAKNVDNPGHHYLLSATRDLSPDAAWRNILLTEPPVSELTMILMYQTDDLHGVLAIRCDIRDGSSGGLTLGHVVDVVLGLANARKLHPDMIHFYIVGSADWGDPDPYPEKACNWSWVEKAGDDIPWYSMCSLRPEWERYREDDSNDEDYVLPIDVESSDDSSGASDAEDDLAAEVQELADERLEEPVRLH